MNNRSWQVIVIGAGPSGMMAAIKARAEGARVLLLEKNPAPGKKLLLTGHGRCNLTNRTIPETFRERYFENARFLNSSFHTLSPQDVCDFFSSIGVSTHEEDGGRMFPDAQKSQAVLDALLKKLSSEGVEILCDTEVLSLSRKEGKEGEAFWEVGTGNGTYTAPCVILATGGKAFPQTGSTGTGYQLAKAAGHTVTSLIPSLSPLYLSGFDGKSTEAGEGSKEGESVLSGLTLEQVRLTLLVSEKTVARSEGGLLFTHQGISGPSAMRLSRYLPERKERSLYEDGKVQVQVHFLPELREDEVEEKILSAMTSDPNRAMKNILHSLFRLPERLIGQILFRTQGDLPANQVTKRIRKKIVSGLVATTYTVSHPAPWEIAYVTRGGINIKEVDPKTMQSKVAPGLLFCGEILDIDGDSGGYNLQHAWASGFVAGQTASTLSMMPQKMINAQNKR